MGTVPHAFVVICQTNPDYNGIWHQKDVLEELNDIHCNVRPAEADYIWMDYVFNHLFAEEPDWTDELNDMFTHNICIRSIEVKLGMHNVKIEKFDLR